MKAELLPRSQTILLDSRNLKSQDSPLIKTRDSLKRGRYKISFIYRT